jgi:hypothetical protein
VFWARRYGTVAPAPDASASSPQAHVCVSTDQGIVEATDGRDNFAFGQGGTGKEELITITPTPFTRYRMPASFGPAPRPRQEADGTEWTAAAYFQATLPGHVISGASQRSVEPTEPRCAAS